MEGHDWDEVYSTIVRSRHVQGRPTMIIAHTKKAKGHRDYENLASSHCLRLTDDVAKKRLLEGIEGLDFEWSKQ